MAPELESRRTKDDEGGSEDGSEAAQVRRPSPAPQTMLGLLERDAEKARQSSQVAEEYCELPLAICLGNTSYIYFNNILFDSSCLKILSGWSKSPIISLNIFHDFQNPNTNTIFHGIVHAMNNMPNALTYIDVGHYWASPMTQQVKNLSALQEMRETQA